MNTTEQPGYRELVQRLAPVLYDLPGVIVSIDGRPGVGKTTLGRYLAWTYNVSLIETDLFLIVGQGRYVYLAEQVLRLIDRRTSIPRPVIVEGVTVGRLLASIGRAPRYRIYVDRSDLDQIDNDDLADYEAAFQPRESVDHLLTLSV